MNTATATDYDVVVIGGACAGASAALLLQRWLPAARILIVERQDRFNRKVGEATVEVSAFFLHHVLGLYDHLARQHLPKHGLRYWFTDSPQRTLFEMSEVGAIDTPRLASFQLDRALLDEHILSTAVQAGVHLARPAKVQDMALGWPVSRVCFEEAGTRREVSTRWLIDASGRQSFIARRLKLHEEVPSHPTAAVWARWDKVADLDGVGILGPDPRAPRLRPVQSSRRLATNHFCGYGWWCWVIPLGGGQTSIGLVYNKELFQLPGSGKPRERFRDFVTCQPGLRELLAGAQMDEDDFFALGHLPYRSRQYMERGWALVGDAAAFIDPYYSPGLDHVAMSVYASARLIEDELAGRLDEAALTRRVAAHNTKFLLSYDRWLKSLYEGKYELMGDAELIRCAYLVETSLYFLNVVSPVERDIEELQRPVLGEPVPQTQVAYTLIRFFNRRLLRLARFRRQAGTYGRRNSGWRPYGRAFELRHRAFRTLAQGLSSWLKLELEYLGYRLRKGRIETSQPVSLPAHTAPVIKRG